MYKESLFQKKERKERKMGKEGGRDWGKERTYDEEKERRYEKSLDENNFKKQYQQITPYKPYLNLNSNK
jgi:hypothetical protein